MARKEKACMARKSISKLKYAVINLQTHLFGNNIIAIKIEKIIQKKI